jgi:hypothetical protein
VGRIEVDPAGLAAAARALGDATAVAREVHRGTRSLGAAAAATGHGRLEAAAEHFRDRWSYGLGLVVEDADTLARMLTQAARIYAQAEQGIAEAAGP